MLATLTFVSTLRWYVLIKLVVHTARFSPWLSDQIGNKSGLNASLIRLLEKL
jgi:hypothetical protein